ncbi:hypothetical protein [Ferroglobus placidus]|uniref:hypothetical protein n=1 Tax=Ferroglobus placidus TaxID=54261 RepID=UPI0011D16226|nr:hypothetical protein [Ferroglobus placidus]
MISDQHKNKNKDMRITQKSVLEKLLELYESEKRPVCIGDLKRAFNVLEKRDAARSNSWRKTDKIEYALRELFKKGKLSRSEKQVRLENYPASPYASIRSRTVNVYFYAPADCAGQVLSFEVGGNHVSAKFIRYEERVKETPKKEMVLEVLKNAERAMTAGEIVEEICKRYDAYKIDSRQDYYNAISSITHAVLKPLRKHGLRGFKLDGKWVWYFTEEQLENFREWYIRNSELLRTARDLVKSEKAVPLSRILSETVATPDEAKYHLKRVAKYIPVEIRVETVDGKTDVHISVPEFKRDSFIDWLGYVVPKSQSGFGYESFLVDLDSDWVEALKAAIRKSLERVNIKTVIGAFYEKLVARVFEVLCTSEELRKNPELSKFAIPFVFRDEKVTNVWIVTEQGRKIEFDVLIRGTFYSFDVMASRRETLDIIIPVECKYRMVRPEDVTAFDDRVRAAFGERRNVLPLMIGLGWNSEALHIAKRLGIMTLYFSAVDKLLSEMLGRNHRHEYEWKKVEEMLNKGEITLKELREKLKKGEWRFEFEEWLLNSTRGSEECKQ